MPLIGGVGDIIALIGVVRELATALDGSRGSKSEYQEVRRELDGLEKALLSHHQLSQARCKDPALNAIFKSTQSTAEDCQKCIEVFSQQTVKFDRSLGVGQGGNICRDVTMKVRWQLSKKEEVARFRAEIGQHISSLNMLLGIANITIQRDNHDKLVSKVDSLDKKIDSTSETQGKLIAEVRDRLEQRISQAQSAVSLLQNDLKPGWLRDLRAELKGLVSQVFTMSGTTLSTVQRIEERLPSKSEMALIRTFVLEDAIGRVTRIDMMFVSSWDAFDAMLEGCFRAYPGHKKVAKKEYVFHDQKTNREVVRSTPWSGAIVPGQQVNMGLIFRRRQRKELDYLCPGCKVPLEESENTIISCACGMSHQRRTEIMDVDENNMPFFDLPDAPSSKTDRPPGWNANGPSSPLDATGHQDMDMADGNEIDEISCFKRVVLVDVEMHVKDIMGFFPPCTPPPNRTGEYYPFSATPSPTGAHGLYSPRTGPSPRQHSRHETSGNAYRYSPRKSSYSYRASYGDSDDVEGEYTDYLVDGVIYRIPCSERTNKRTYKYLGQDSGPYYYYQDPGSANGESDETPPRRRRRESSTTSERPRPTRATPKKAPPTPKATEADARKHRIPPGYSLKNWDPTEEPIMLLGSVFDANSLGKWIYDWAVYHHGSATPLADMAGELWLLLIQLAGKVKRAEECMPRIRKEENRETVDDFIESGERLTDKLKKILKTVETSMLKAGKRKEDENNFVGKNAGIEFVDSIFGPDRQLEATEKFMQSIRLWNLRFDANCEDILRRPGQF